MKCKKTEGAWTTGWPTLRLRYKAKLIFTYLSCCYRVCYTHLTQILINTILSYSGSSEYRLTSDVILEEHFLF